MKPPVMLDTSACIEILRGNAPPLEWKGRKFLLSSVVEAELWAGVYHSGGARERGKVEKLLAAVEAVPFDSAAARATGEVLGKLTRAGKKIGDFDAQIAGHALATRSQLLTKNPAHFRRIEALEVIPWPTPRNPE